jgi:endonuclease YncB( thermonuclease family)
MTTTIEHNYIVNSVLRVVDGDTYWVKVDTGFRQELLIEVRAADLDTPEKNKGSEFERSQARLAQEFVSEFFSDAHRRGRRLWIHTEKDPDNFGRWLGDIWWEDLRGEQEHLSNALIAVSLATVYPTRWYEVYDPTGRK